VSAPVIWRDVRPYPAKPALSRTVVVKPPTPYAAAAQHFEHTVQAGVDNPLPRAYPASRQYPVSEYLGECSKAAQALLFQASHKAMQGDNAEAGHLLRRFVEQCGKDYADDHEEAFA
jgi:hypothetical protein